MSRNNQGDPRVRGSVPDARGARAEADDQRTENDGTALTQADRVAMIRSEFQQEALPTVPVIPGWHVCWLSTTSAYDPIHKRMRLGYAPVRMEEVKGLDTYRMKSGEFEGCISCNEMVLFKIPEETYQAIMMEFHHNMPLEEEENLKRNLERNDEDSEGQKLGSIEGDGFQQLVQKRRPVFG